MLPCLIRHITRYNFFIWYYIPKNRLKNCFQEEGQITKYTGKKDAWQQQGRRRMRQKGAENCKKMQKAQNAPKSRKAKNAQKERKNPIKRQSLYI